MWITSSVAIARTPTTIALGNFDGVHQGHQRVIEPVLRPAVVPVQQVPIRVGDSSPIHLGATPVEFERPHITVVTFHPHPQEFFSGQSRVLLTPLEEKADYLQQLGVEQLVMLPFDQDLANLSPQKFVELILVQQLQAQQISVGCDFRFGCRRAGTAADLQAIAAQYGIHVHIVPLHTCEGERISSSAIRQALQQGDVSTANRYLGRPYQLMGSVVQGQQLGRQLGFPTANLQVPADKLLPRSGVYAVQVQCHAWGVDTAPRSGVMNIGSRPTVQGTQQTIEVHLLDWTGDLYGETLKVSLCQFLRPEQRFPSLDDLKTQITADCATARMLLADLCPTS